MINLERGALACCFRPRSVYYTPAAPVCRRWLSKFPKIGLRFEALRRVLLGRLLGAQEWCLGSLLSVIDEALSIILRDRMAAATRLLIRGAASTLDFVAAKTRSPFVDRCCETAAISVHALHASSGRHAVANTRRLHA